MRATMTRLLRVGVLFAALGHSVVFAENNSNPFEDVMPIMGKPVYFYKKGHIPDGAVMLFSDAQGWGDKEEAMANRLSKGGKLVIGVDTPAMLQRMEQQSDACVEVMGEIENLSRNSQYALDTPSYHSQLWRALVWGLRWRWLSPAKLSQQPLNISAWLTL